MTNLFARQIPTKGEAFFIIIIAIGIVAVLGYSDIIHHDFYVKPSISHCFPTNQDEFCTNLRALHGLESDAQIDIGNKYWEVQRVQIFAFLILLFIIKVAIVFGKPGKNERIKFSGIILFTAMVWAISVGALFYFAGIDWMYYELRPDVPMPDELPWLNEMGALSVLKGIGGDPNMVERNEVHFAFFMGLGIVLGLWLLLIYKTKKLNKQMKRNGI